MEYIIDLRQAADKQEMQEAIRMGMGWPEYYGGNWDAFCDMISETVRPDDTLRILGDISATPMEKILTRLGVAYTAE